MGHKNFLLHNIFGDQSLPIGDKNGLIDFHSMLTWKMHPNDCGRE